MARDGRHLEDVVIAGRKLVFPVRRLAPDELAAWRQVGESGYEGYVAKDEASGYVGGITRSWLKVKVRSWTDPEDRWRRRITVAPPGGWSAARKYERVREVLEGLALRLANLRSEVTEEYVRSDEQVKASRPVSG